VVQATFRKPAGVVLLDGEQYLVDADGHYLPEWLFSAPAEWQVEQTPLIMDGRLRGRPAVGRRWGGPRVAAGARLVEFFRGAGLLKELDLASVDVTAVGGSAAEPAIVLATAGGTRIRWGESSAYEQVPGLRAPPYLTPDNEKLAMLRSKLEHFILSLALVQFEFGVNLT
jgi:hypothetical protein